MSLIAPWTTRSRIEGMERTRTFWPPSFGISFFRCWHGSIRVVDQFVSNLFQKTLQSVFLDGFERDPIDSWGSVVTLCHLVGFPKRFYLADVDVQSPEAPGWFSLRLDV